ncbi:hypothetical protein CHS0354_027238 [Potamilus streckersoni]|uniref:C2 domain-containing protein n=1 Tax=Potamilus streckersoni TaxID=2493646 RepID=A0AAE0VH33_9BIVA|nr:hypothetical protein CHS0354_027238 [Potamilus streckersoni]
MNAPVLYGGFPHDESVYRNTSEGYPASNVSMPVTDGTSRTSDVTELTAWDKLVIIAVAAGVLTLAMVCMVCIVSEHCLLYRFCPCNRHDDTTRKKGQKKKKRNYSEKSTGVYGSTDSALNYSESDAYGVELTTMHFKSYLPIIKDYDTSDWSSDASIHDVIHLGNVKNRQQVVPDGSIREVDKLVQLENGNLVYTLKYDQSSDKLTIHILEAKDLKFTNMSELISPYIKIRLYRAPKQFFNLVRGRGKDHVINNLDKELKTKMQRPGDTLSYKETFEVPLDLDSFSNYTIRFLLCDMDKFSRHVVLGESTVSLRKVELPNSVEVPFTHQLQQPESEDLGEINVGICYLPTSEKVYLSLNWIRGLKVMDKRKKTTDPCVKAYLMYEGKTLKRVKTSIKERDLNPTFEETFTFDVPQRALERIYFSIAVLHSDKQGRDSKLIGRTYIGLNFDIMAREQWMNMMQNPRRQIACWHRLLN